MVLEFVFDYMGYYANYFLYFAYSCFDLLWYPFAVVVNAGLGLITAMLNIVLTLFAWSNVTFSYFVVSLIIFFMFGIFVKIFLWLKAIILQWV